MTWLRDHAVLVGAAILGAVSFAIFTWAERGYFCDQAASHKEPCGDFWTREHLHDWIYNAFANYTSDLLIGILLLLILFKIEGPHGADQGDT